MLKRRVAASLVVKNGTVVQSIQFKKYLPVGRPPIAVEFLNRWGIDEIILLDISASKFGTGPDYAMVKQSAEKCLVPLTVGGGITRLDQVQELMHCGADKIALNQVALQNPDLVSRTAHVYGNQCVVVSVDSCRDDAGRYWVYDYLSGNKTRWELAEFVKKMESLGAGEILVNSVERDGSYNGYDVELIRKVCGAVKIPVICVGGARNANDFVEVFSQTPVSAAAAGNFFHFTEHSVNVAKSIIRRSVEVRMETHANYTESEFDDDMRLRKKKDSILEDMLYVRIEKEII